MIKNRILSLVGLVLSLTICYAQQAPQLIPMPEKYQSNQGSFVFNSNTTLVLPDKGEELYFAVKPLVERFRQASHLPLKVEYNKKRKNAIVCTLNKKVQANEEYHLYIKPSGIEIEASTPQGIFYGIQTLRQLLPSCIEKNEKCTDVVWSVPCAEISDKPEFAYRGFMLDVGRHFMPTDFVKRCIDFAAFHKMNKFHWHLTEDQGWRIEIKKYPKLTSVGAYRNMTLKNHFRDSVHQWRTERYGDFYSQDEIKEVVEYARQNFIEVIPEIEVPGHALAALAAYPEFSCSGGPFEVGTKWGVFEDIFCSREETFTFIEDILDEVAELFPSKEIHIGGDEAPRERWSRCHACQQRISELKLKDEAELQTYFLNRVGDHLRKKGKNVIGWDEIIEGGIPKDATVMIWRDDKWANVATERGHQVILTPSSHYYLNVPQGKLDKEPMGPRRIITLDQTYNYQPIKKNYSKEQVKLIRGVQANVWTEYIATPEHVEYMMAPRLAAVAETAWRNPEKKNFNEFYTRLKLLLQRYEAMGINYSRSFEEKRP